MFILKKILSLLLLTLACFGFSISTSADEAATSLDIESSTLTASEKASVDAYINENLDHIFEIAKSSSNYIEGQATLSSDD